MASFFLCFLGRIRILFFLFFFVRKGQVDSFAGWFSQILWLFWCIFVTFQGIMSFNYVNVWCPCQFLLFFMGCIVSWESKGAPPTNKALLRDY